MSNKQGFTSEQLAFIKHKEPNSVILSATAGSGKTASATGRLIWLLNQGVNPEKIIYFSFTNDAVDELRTRINNDKIEITTIHSFCARVLGKCKKFKPLVDTSFFPNWYKKKYAPTKKTPLEQKIFYDRACRQLADDPKKIFSDISKYKLTLAEGEKDRLPSFFKQYQRFLIETRTRDFADMLTDTLYLTGFKSWENNFEYKYHYVFVDEYQDTSALQMEILLALRAKMYHLIGDRNQSIYGFQGSDCYKIEKLLKEKKSVTEYNLSVNFRSAKGIVENANMYSDLIATPHHTTEGHINQKLLTERELISMMREKDVVILARTNSVIKSLEMFLLSRKVPMRYFNILDDEDLEIITERKELTKKQAKKFKKILPYFDGTADEMVSFISEHCESKSFVTSIHKSKGREYPNVVIVNSLSPEVLEHNGIILEAKELKRMSFDPDDIEDRESKNIHYVAVTRPKDELYYMMVDEESGQII
jgi:superfamily I DNA/RNA helicase